MSRHPPITLRSPPPPRASIFATRRAEASSIEKAILSGASFGDSCAMGRLRKERLISDYVFPSGPEAGGYKGLPNLWRTVQKTARVAAESASAERGEPAPNAGPLDGITLHSLRHSFAGVAEQLGATIPTIAAMLGHRLGGVTGGYILKRVDVLLVDAANRVGDHIEMLMRGEAPTSTVVQFVPKGRARPKPGRPALALAS